jgi:hypothetical protein
LERPKKVIAFVNQQQHGNRFQAGGDRILLDLHDRRLSPVTAIDPEMRQLEIDNLPKHLQRPVKVPSNTLYATVFNNQRMVHRATPIVDTGFGDYSPNEGRRQTAWEYVEDIIPYGFM